MPNLIPGDLGPTCPDCGTPLRSGRDGCPHCGFSPHEPREFRGGLLAPFGHGFCGFAIGALAGLVLSLTYEVRSAAWMPLAGLLLCVVGATLASQVGKRLAPELRCAYEHLLISLVGGGLVTMMAIIVCPLPLDTCGLLWLGSAALGYVLMRRYGYRDGTGMGTG